MKAADATEETHCELELVSVKSVYMLRLIPLFLGSICLNLTTFKTITTDLDKKKWVNISVFSSYREFNFKNNIKIRIYFWCLIKCDWGNFDFSISKILAKAMILIATGRKLNLTKNRGPMPRIQSAVNWKYTREQFKFIFHNIIYRIMCWHFFLKMQFCKKKKKCAGIYFFQ